ncbi:LysR family transcriptional regulator [Pseudoduganella namucuonensis]|uniref:DNA-binding transcriptional regulator, LysR family n=1 Tax=Pseudoduganella namucuonensis TaxID=1035707 RepID=A0A1I7EVD9_9BURK|nr:LysR family transcriptional regulator [Pseudoduganella namucuonensis]SFU27888.1 DNA-binding transcriptional regulator, LysR family [Pseudoduganella namucuonensis]
MDTIRSLQYFVRAVELGSLSAVAREHGTTQPTVSKVVAALEESLGVRLLERSTASLSPTVQGRRFYERARGVLEEYAEAVADARGQTRTASGLLRVNAPVALGQFRLNALVQEFLRRYPEIEIELILNDRMADLVEEGVDVALRLGGDLPPNAIARRLGASPRYLVAAPSYLKGRAPLRRPEDLAAHDYIRYAWLASGDKVELGDGARTVAVETRGRFRVNNALAIRESLALGAGIGLCPAWLVQDLLDARKLRRVLPKWRGTPQELNLLYPSRRYQPLRARLFMDFVRERLAGFEG